MSSPQFISATMALPTNPKAFRDFELKGWEKAAPVYSATFGVLTQQSIESLLKAVNAEPGDKLLDVACGPGFVAARAAQLGCDVVAIDFSPRMVEIARQAYPHLHIQVGDVERLKFPSAIFDIVVSNHGLIHFSQPEKALSELARVTKKGGRIGLTLWDSLDKATAFRLVIESAKKYAQTPVSLPEGPDMFKYTDTNVFKQLLNKTGWGQVKFSHLPIIWHLSYPDALVDTLMTATVRMASKLKGQSQQSLDKIKAAVRIKLKPYTNPDGSVAIPQGVLLATGVCT